MTFQELRSQLHVWLPGPFLWKSVAVVALSTATALLLSISLPHYHTQPIFLLLTVSTVAATLIGGWPAGLGSFALTIFEFWQLAGVIQEPVRARLFANACVDLLFIVLIGYLRFVARGREHARLAAVASSILS
jgi:hypothetical protein